MPFPTTGVLDDLNRANATPLDGAWTLAWYADESSSPNLSGNAIHGKTNNVFWGIRSNATNYGPDCEAFFSIPTVDAASDFTITVRVGGTLANPNGYTFKAFPGGSQGFIKRIDAGSETTLGAAFTVNTTFAAGEKFGLSAVGTTLTAYYFTGGVWTVAATRTDATYTGAGAIAFEGAAANIAAMSVDDLGGGTIPVTGLTAVQGAYALSGQAAELSITVQQLMALDAFPKVSMRKRAHL